MRQTKEGDRYFHSSALGCRIIDCQIGKLKQKYCKTHKKYICRCGYEWGHHFGSTIPGINLVGEQHTGRLFKGMGIFRENKLMPKRIYEKKYEIHQIWDFETRRWKVIWVDKSGKKFQYKNGELSPLDTNI